MQSLLQRELWSQNHCHKTVVSVLTGEGGGRGRVAREGIEYLHVASL